MLRTLSKHLFGEITPKYRKKVQEALVDGSKDKPDFYVLTALSSLLAALGLVLNNAAVIIGAMVVAPLMVPVIAMSFASITGNFKLFYKATKVETKGVILAIGVSALLAIFIPNLTFTPEIMVRTKPTILDLMIALTAGMAGAYAFARPKLSASLPGIAIAVALIPPLATVGIGLAHQRFDVALGSLLLFVSNLIAINLASSLTFLILGYNPWPERVLACFFDTSRCDEKELAVLNSVKVSLLLLLLVSVPLGYIMYTTAEDARTKNLIEKTLREQIEKGMRGSELVRYDYKYTSEGRLYVTATIDSAEELSRERVETIRNIMESDFGRPVDLEIKVVVVKVVSLEGENV